MTYTYYPVGVCSKKYEIDIVDGIIKDLRIQDGCAGNTQGIVRLVRNQSALAVADLLEGVPCGQRKSSCPDQIAIALREAVRAAESEERSDGNI